MIPICNTPRLVGLLTVLAIAYSSQRALADGGGLIKSVPPDLLRIAPGSVSVLLQGVKVSDAISDGKGGIWAATEERGLAHLDPGAKAWTYRTKAPGGLPDDALVSVRVFGGALWVGTAMAGIVRIEGTKVHAFTAAAGTLPDDHVHAMVVFGDRLWVVTDLGLAILDGEKFVAKFVAQTASVPGTPEGSPTALATSPDGKLWVGTDDSEVCVFNGKTWTRWSFKGKLPGRVIRCVSPAGDGIWFGTFGGLSSYWPAVSRLDDETTEKPALFPTRMITALAAAPGLLLVGTGGGGLYRLDLSGETWHVYDASNGLGATIVNAVEVDGTVALISTKSGLSRIDLAMPLPAPKVAPPAPSAKPSSR